MIAYADYFIIKSFSDNLVIRYLLNLGLAKIEPRCEQWGKVYVYCGSTTPHLSVDEQ